jgi:phosphoglycolate phosphatase-like HAD superfamily hydrolase
MRIALFDIDGTILLAHGAGSRAMQRALRELTGTAGPGGLHYAGKTDGQIVREAMRSSGFSDAEVDAALPAILERYLAHLERELDGDADERPEVLPGVPELLAACRAHDGVVLGLLTGNLVRGAERKLRAVGVDPGQFVIGAYGSDHEHRPALAALARERAAAFLGRDVDPASCVVIGDTPADVACAHAIGARAVAVATGGFTQDALRACGADVVFGHLGDTAAAMDAILHG